MFPIIIIDIYCHTYKQLNIDIQEGRYFLGYVKGLFIMISDSDVIDQRETYNSTFSTEVMNWYYNNDQDTIIIIWNKRNEIIYVSELIEDYFDYNVSDLIGRAWTILLPDKQVKRINEHFEEEKNKLHIPNIVIPSKNGNSSFNAIIGTIEIKGESYYICKLRNITYMNELKQVLIDSEKLVLAGQLSAGLVHEIRNPLTSLKGFLQLVQAGVKQKEEYYKVMIGEIDKLEKISSELLHMAKPFKGIKKTEAIRTLIDDVLFIMSTQTDMKDVHFTLELMDDLVSHCNAPQIKQVLINLIKNGAEAMEKQGTLKIKTRKENEFVAIDVIDEGEGVPDEIVNDLNNPFFTTKQEGTGLGLVITHHILDLHQGELKVSSEQGKGTTFTILLPCGNSE